nr:hypothetical protein Iba_chr11dCG6120 [Ipomoea batatas]
MARLHPFKVRSLSPGYFQHLHINQRQRCSTPFTVISSVATKPVCVLSSLRVYGHHRVVSKPSSGFVVPTYSDLSDHDKKKKIKKCSARGEKQRPSGFETRYMPSPSSQPLHALSILPSSPLPAAQPKSQAVAFSLLASRSASHVKRDLLRVIVLMSNLLPSCLS